MYSLPVNTNRHTLNKDIGTAKSFIRQNFSESYKYKYRIFYGTRVWNVVLEVVCIQYETSVAWILHYLLGLTVLAGAISVLIWLDWVE